MKVSKSKKPKEKLPESFLEMFFLLVKEYIKGIPKSYIMSIVKTVVVFVVIFLYSYILTMKNEGFKSAAININSFLLYIKSMSGSTLIFWAIFSFLISNISSRILNGGFSLFIKDITTTPKWLIKNFKEAGKIALGAFLLPLGLGLMLSLLVSVKYLLILYAIALIFSIISQKKGLILLALKLIWQDWNKIFKTKSFKNGKNPNMGIITLIITGFSLSFLVSFFLPFKPYSPFIIFALFLVLFILLLLLPNRKKI